MPAHCAPWPGNTNTTWPRRRRPGDHPARRRRPSAEPAATAVSPAAAARRGPCRARPPGARTPTAWSTSDQATSAGTRSGRASRTHRKPVRLRAPARPCSAPDTSQAGTGLGRAPASGALAPVPATAGDRRIIGVGVSTAVGPAAAGGGLLEDDVRVGAADAERRHAGPPRPAVRRPRRPARSAADRAGRPVDVRRRLVDVQRARQHAVPHRQHHLDHARPTPAAAWV